MPRIPRLHVDGAFYHVILRGNHRQNIFFKPEDRARFSNLVAENIDRFRMRVHAYCWMTNHVHLAIQVSDLPLGKAMMRVARRFAWEQQRRPRNRGHFFERRYRALLVDADSYLLELIRYIHLNPVRAGMVDDPADYPYSGHRAYLGRAPTPWLTSDFALSLLAPEVNRAREAYRLFVKAGIGIAGENWLTGRPEEPRVLGDDRFLAGLSLSRRPRSRMTLADLIDQVCLEQSANAADLAGPSRLRCHSRIRAIVLERALRLRIASLAEVARRFDRSGQTLSKSLRHYLDTEPEIFKDPIEALPTS
jgi:putative transposase